MNLEDQLCPPAQAKRLKNLGIMQESLHYYNENGINIHSPTGLIVLKNLHIERDSEDNELDSISAFTVAELGAALPCSLNGAVIIMENSEAIKYVSYQRIKTTFGSTEAQARANMLIWLIENKYITVREVNKRITET
jgi:hypothetical protein